MSLQVGFLKGTQAKINQLLNGSGDRFQAGAFYITEDSNRIYFAQSASNLQYLNKYITSVAKASDLPTDLTSENIGDFYYITEGNILCRYDGDTNESGVSGYPKWTQVNAQIPDTDTTNKVASLAIGDGILNTAQDAIEFTLTATEQKYDVKSNTAVGTAYDIVTDADKKFVLNKSILDNWYNKTNIDLNATVDANNNKATVKLNGTGAVSGNEVTITGGANVTIAANGTDGIKISATDTNTTYSMASPANEAKIHLDSSVGNNDAGSVEFKAGTDLSVSGTVAGQITYAHKTGYLDVAADQILNAQTPAEGATFDIVSGVQTSNGHVTAVNTSTVKLPRIADIKNSGENDIEAENGKIVIVVKDGAGNEVNVQSSEQFGLNVGDTLVPLGGDLKNYFYTETEIDTKFADHLKNVNAMVFKGALPTAAFPSNPAIGDTYIVTQDSNLAIGGKKLQTGDIVIASGEENTDGAITNPTWILVESNEIDTTYTLAAVGDYITLTPSTSAGADDQVQKIELTDDGVVTLSTNNGAIKAEHSKTEPTDVVPTSVTPLNYNDNNGLLVVTNVDANEYGHVTAIESAKIKLPDVQKLSHNESTGATELKDGIAGNVVGSIDVNGSGVISVNSEDNNNGSNYTISHNELTSIQKVDPATPETATMLDPTSKFTVVDGVTRDAYGHVTGYTLAQYEMPVANVLKCRAAHYPAGDNVPKTGVILEHRLIDRADNVASATADGYVSDNTNLKITYAVKEDAPTGSGGFNSNQYHCVSFDLVWGTF